MVLRWKIFIPVVASVLVGGCGDGESLADRPFAETGMTFEEGYAALEREFPEIVNEHDAICHDFDAGSRQYFDDVKQAIELFLEVGYPNLRRMPERRELEQQRDAIEGVYRAQSRLASYYNGVYPVLIERLDSLTKDNRFARDVFSHRWRERYSNYEFNMEASKGWVLGSENRLGVLNYLLEHYGKWGVVDERIVWEDALLRASYESLQRRVDNSALPELGQL